MPTDDRTSPSSKPSDKRDQPVRDLPERKVGSEKEEQVKGGSVKRPPEPDQA